MTTEHEDDIGFDLTAWEAPPPPAGIADAVIARVERVGAPAIEHEAPSRARYWIAGGVLAAAVVIAVIAFGLRASTEEYASSSGAVAVAKPSHLELGATAVDLEANTDVWWVRDGKRVVAMQPRGTALWSVAAGDELVIDAGATVASVSASGASLRVEVEMNLSDGRLIGTSAVTAAAVALVTVIVYEGHVRVTGADRTVDVPAGGIVEIAPHKPPVEPDRVSGLEQRLRSDLEASRLENTTLRKKLEADTRGTADREAFRAVMQPVAGKLDRCIARTDFDELDLVIELRADGTHRMALDLDGRPITTMSSTVLGCLENVVAGLSFPTSIRRGTYGWHVAAEDKTSTVTVRKDAAKCGDATRLDELERKGEEHMIRGSYTAGLATFEEVLKCRPSVVAKAYLAACKSHQFPKAKRYFAMLQPRQEPYAQICLKEGFDPR